MKLDDFIKLAKQRKDFPTHNEGKWTSEGIILSDTYLNGIPWEFRKDLAEAVSKINFGCGFRNNSCIKEREYPSPLFFTPAVSLHVNHCCSRCFQTIGNSIILPAEEKILTEIAALFDEKAEGFWRLNKGCTLPPMYRSTMCLTERCDYVASKHKLSKEDLTKIWKLINIKQLWKGRQ